MPNYDYKCHTCGKVFEAARPVDERDYAICIWCGDSETIRLLTAPPIHFKGSGFYATDK